MKIRYVQIALITLLASSSAFAQTDSNLLKEEVKKQVAKKIKGKTEYSRSLQDILNEKIKDVSEEPVVEPVKENKVEEKNTLESVQPLLNKKPKAEEIPTPKKIEVKEEKTSDTKSKVEAALEQASIEADDLEYDSATKILTAEHNVLLSYQGRELRSEKIGYNQGTRMITADNGLEYKDATGTIFKAESAVVTDSFDKGEMKNVDVDFGDGSSFHSNDLTILGANQYDLKKSTYSPCDICVNGKHLWQVDAQKIFYNEADGRVYYRDAYLKLMGKKIGWLPYLSHPTPFAKSKSGFLSPKFGNSSNYGFFIVTPYYYQPKENMDFTFTPMITTEDGPILTTEMRHLMENGEYEIEISGAYPREKDDFGKNIPGGDKQFRGHIKAKGDFTYGENWEYGFDTTRTTDDTYLRRYNMGNYEDVLKSEVYADRISGRNFFAIKALSFQGLRATDDPGQSPVVTPLIEAGRTFQVSEKYNSRVETNLNTMVLNRGEGTDSSRFIGGAKWKADYTSTGGHIFNLAVGTRADYYNVNKVPYLGSTYEGPVSRVMPAASLTWSYPLQKLGETYSLILEPISMATVSPNGNNRTKIPNEDSQNIDLSDYNLFQENHISGYDLIEDGFRLNYGVRGVVSSDDFGEYNFLLGQNYRASTDDQTFTESSGLRDNYSDFVGRIVTGTKKVQTAYRFRLDKDNSRFKRNEIGVNLNLDDIQLASGYAFIAGEPGVSTDRQEVSANTTVKLTDSVSVMSHAIHNLDNDSDEGWVNAGAGVVYTNKCLTGTIELNKEFTRDRDLEPSTELIFKITLQNFGS